MQKLLRRTFKDDYEDECPVIDKYLKTNDKGYEESTGFHENNCFFF